MTIHSVEGDDACGDDDDFDDDHHHNATSGTRMWITFRSSHGNFRVIRSYYSGDRGVIFKSWGSHFGIIGGSFGIFG